MELEAKKDVNGSVPDDKDDDGWKEMGFCSKAKYVFQNITVEPLLALFQVSSVMSSLTTQNLNLQKACRVNLQLGDGVCDGLENKNMSFYAKQEVQVQQMVADMLIWQTIIQSSIPCVLVMFIGSWSDRNRKRKLCMLIPVIGELVRNTGLLMCVLYFNEFKMEIAGLVESIPSSIAGGLTVLYLAAFSYMGDISSMKNRTLRVGLMHLFFGSAWPIGSALSGVLFQKTGFYGVYSISTLLYIIAFFYGLIRIREHAGSFKENQSIQTSKSCMHLMTDFFNLKHIKEAFYVTFKTGSRRKCVRLIVLILTIILVQGPTQGEMSVGYMYTRVRFNWNEVNYSMFSTFFFVANIIGVGFAVGVLSHLLKIDDALIGVMSCLSKVLAGFVFAFAPSEFVFYIGALVDVMSSSSHIVVRTILSKTVPQTELGQVSAIIAVIETIVPVIYKPTYSAIYKATVNKFPGAFYVIGSLMISPSIYLYWWMYRINKEEIREKCTAEEDKLNGELHVPIKT